MPSSSSSDSNDENDSSSGDEEQQVVGQLHQLNENQASSDPESLPSDSDKNVQSDAENREDSDSSENSQTSNSDDEIVNKQDESTTAKQLFGENAELSSSDDDEDKQALSSTLVDNEYDDKVSEIDEDEIVGPRLYPDPDDEEQDSVSATQSVIEVEAPRISVDLGEQNSAYFVKFPNFLSVEPRPFDPEHFEDEIDEDDQLDEEGRSRLKLKVENTIRWRFAQDKDGNTVRQSNAKIVKWSDGSMSLYLGNEIFDVHPQPVQDHNHLFVRQGAGLQGQSLFRTKLTFRPHSTDTLTHRKMTLNMADRSTKWQKTKMLLDVGVDPETQKQQIVRREEERLRASVRRDTQQRRIKERLSGRYGALSSGFLEPDRDYDSDEGESLSAIKRSYLPGGSKFDRRKSAVSDSDQSDAELGGRRLNRAKVDGSDSDSTLREKKKTKKIVIDDDEESG